MSTVTVAEIYPWVRSRQYSYAHVERANHGILTSLFNYRVASSLVVAGELSSPSRPPLYKNLCDH